MEPGVSVITVVVANDRASSDRASALVLALSLTIKVERERSKHCD
jgi:hypothetical protein